MGASVSKPKFFKRSPKKKNTAMNHGRIVLPCINISLPLQPATEKFDDHTHEHCRDSDYIDDSDDSGGYEDIDDSNAATSAVEIHELSTSSPPSKIPSDTTDSPIYEETSECYRSLDAEKLRKDVVFEIEDMVTVFRPLLEECLSVIEIIPTLHFIENHQRYITKEKECDRVAMGLLLDAIVESEDPGKWRRFMEALTAAGYDYIVNLLTGQTEEDHTTQRRIIHLFKPQLIRDMYTPELVDLLFANDLISSIDKEHIECELRTRGHIAAALLVLDRIHRRLTDWFPRFIQILRDSGHQHLADELDILEVQNDASYEYELPYTDETNRKRQFPKIATNPEVSSPPLRSIPNTSISGRTQHQQYYNEYLNPRYPNYETKPPIPPLPPSRRALSETEKLQQKKAELEARLVECKITKSLRKEIRGLRKQIYAIERANDSSSDEDCDILTEVQDGDVDTRHPPKTVKPVSTKNSSMVVPVSMDNVKVLVKEEIEAQVKPSIVELQKLRSLIETHFGTAVQTHAPPTAHLQRLNKVGYVASSRDQYTSGYDSTGYAGSVYVPYSSNSPNDHEEMYI